MTRWAKRRNANESDLVGAARRMGLKVFYTNELGDLVIQWGEIAELVEVKTEEGKLTATQCRLRQAGLKARIVRNVNDMLNLKRDMLDKQKAISIQRREKYGIPES